MNFNASVALVFLESLGKTEIYLNANTAGTRSVTPESIERILAEAIANKANVYYQLANGLPGGRSAKNLLASTHWLHVDVDPLDGHSLDKERDRIAGLFDELPEGVPPPTYVIDSGRGYQGLWKLKESLPLPENEVAVEAANLWLMDRFQAGKGTHNVDRILRVPGSWNFPNEKKLKQGFKGALADVFLDFPDREYSLSDFGTAQTKSTSSFSAIETNAEIIPVKDLMFLDNYNVRNGITRLIIKGHPGLWLQEYTDDFGPPGKNPHGRSEWMFDVVCSLLRAGVPDGMIMGVLTNPYFLISQHILDQGDPADYAKRQVERGKGIVAKDDPPPPGDGGSSGGGGSPPKTRVKITREELLQFRPKDQTAKAKLKTLKTKNEVDESEALLIADAVLGINPTIDPESLCEALGHVDLKERVSDQQKKHFAKAEAVAAKKVSAQKLDSDRKLFVIEGVYGVTSIAEIIPKVVDWLSSHSDIYVYRSKLARWSGREDGLKTFNSDNFSATLDMGFQFGKEAKEGTKILAMAPTGIRQAILTTGFFNDIRKCDVVLTHPTVDSTGVVYGSGEGYCEKSRAYYNHKLTIESMDPEKAARILYDPYSEFIPKALVGGMSALFSLLARPHVGNTPMHLFDAHNPGSGKTLMAEIAAEIVVGAVAKTNVSRDTDEFDKAVRAAILEGRELIFFDNAVGHVASPALDNALTCNDMFNTRVLGRTENSMIEHKGCIFMTANNAQLSEDLLRRTLRIDVDPGVENPAQRETKRNAAQLRAFVRDSRHDLLSAAVSWMTHAMTIKDQAEIQVMNNFDKWSQTVAVSAHLLIQEWKRLDLIAEDVHDDPIPSLDERRSDENDALETLIESVPHLGFIVSEILERDGPHPEVKRTLLDLIGEPRDSKTASRRLRTYAGKIRNGKSMQCHGPSNKPKRWYALPPGGEPPAYIESDIHEEYHNDTSALTVNKSKLSRIK